MISEKLDRVNKYFQECSLQLGRKNHRLFYAQFFWFSGNAFNEQENTWIINRILNRYNRPFLIHATIYFIKNVSMLFKALFYQLKNFIPQVKIFGAFKDSTKHVIVTWLYKKDIGPFVSNNIDGYWKDLYKQIDSFQVVVVPVFIPTKEDILKVTSAGHLILSMDYAVCFLETIKAFMQIVFLKLSISDKLLAFISVLNPRYSKTCLLEKLLEDQLPNRALNLFLPWENQAEQKAICSIANKKGYRTYGYIHSSPTNFPGHLLKPQNDWTDVYYPTHILHHSTIVRDFFLQYTDYPKERIVGIRSQRLNKRPDLDFKGKMYLPFNRAHAVFFLNYVVSLQRDGREISIAQIVPHPIYATDQKILNLISQIKTDISADAVIVAGFSTIMFEALEAGLSVIQLSIDPNDLCDENIYSTLKVKKIDRLAYQFDLKTTSFNSLLDFREESLRLSVFINSLPQKKPALFLDRDGIIIEDKGYPYEEEDAVIKDDIIPIIKEANKRNWPVVVVSNQAGLAKNKFSLEQYFAFTKIIERKLVDRGVIITEWLFCPYHKPAINLEYQRDSYWRKPMPGMILHALKKHDIDLYRSFMIGDKDSDRIHINGLRTCIFKGNYRLSGEFFNDLDSISSNLFTS